MKINKIVIDKQKRLAELGRLAQPITELFSLGNVEILLEKPTLAIVGSRDATDYGREVTYQLAYKLAEAGIVIISGLALGVDSIAHQATIDAGGKTIAVIPCGLDEIYPARHRQLAKEILTSGGALVSEYPTGQESPMKYQFIARNRIIAALSDGVLITEAAKKSGSLHTAEFALEQGKDVFAVPGDITSLNSVGTNELINTGAVPVVGVDVLLEHFNLTT